jgi:predicted RNA-binding protein associated with RNAse of E/G family
MDVNALPETLPEILEVKRTLAGARKQFRCRRLACAPGAVTVLFVSDRPYVVGGLTLATGTVTFGHFWEDRPYNVYHWLDPDGRTLAHYFNLADGTRIQPDTLAWLDLAIDVLVRPGIPPQVLDEHELPADLDPRLRVAVDAARAAVLADHPAVIAALEARADELWPRLTGGARR